MSDPSANSQASGNTSNDLSQTLASAMNFVQSQEENQSISAVTLDTVIQGYINSLQSGVTTSVVDPEGNTVYNRPSQFDQLTALQASINAAVSAIQAAGNDPAQLAALGLIAPQD